MPYGLIIAALILAGVCTFAWAQGGPAERAGSILLVIVWIFSTVAWVVCREWLTVNLDHTGVVLNLCGDAVLAIGFLVLALRYSSLWLGVGMIIQGAEFMLNALYLGDPTASRTQYISRVNLVSISIELLLVVATVTAWRARVRGRRNKASSPAAPEFSVLLGPPPLPPGALS